MLIQSQRSWRLRRVVVCTLEQMAWEEALFTQLAEPLKRMVGQMFRTDQKTSIRAPRRTTPQRKMTIDELHTGIAVQEI